MKFEKINKDKMKITLNSDDLHANDIDLHSFMANSDETQSLFFYVLERAEKDYGFSTKDYNLKFETIALSDGNFILTITREIKSLVSAIPSRKKLHVTRRSPTISTSIIYKFNCFDDFCKFSEFINNCNYLNLNQLTRKSTLYNYKNNYFLVLINVNTSSNELKNLCSAITEFATYISSSDVFIAKLHESGSIIFKDKAVQSCIKYFVH